MVPTPVVGIKNGFLTAPDPSVFIKNGFLAASDPSDGIKTVVFAVSDPSDGIKTIFLESVRVLFTEFVIRKYAYDTQGRKAKQKRGR